MWGIGLALALVACGVVFIVLGLQAQQAAETALTAALFKWTPKATADDTLASFLNCSTFAFAMDAPEFTSFYLWNLTNARDLLGGGGGGLVQPQLKQLGPYTYEKRTRKLNVEFHAIQDDAYASDSYGAVSYQVTSTYHFSSERSNGSESDIVVALNASYVRHLTKLHAQTGRSERFLAAEFAHAHIRDYTEHLQSDFLAATKLRALRALLPEMVADVKHEGLTAVIHRQRRRVGDANLPATLVRMHAVTRTEQIPVMLRDVYRDQADVAIPGLLTEQFALARRQAVPRVLSNLYNRLLVEAVPALLGQQIEAQETAFVPRTLGSLNLKLQRIAFPYVMQEVFERACLEAVPFILRSIKSEIVERDMASNRATADDAQLAAVNLWRQQGSTPTDFDAWIDDNPTGEPRTGFELLPTTSALELSLEVATLLLGFRPSNLRFSLVDYDAARTAADGLGGSQTTAVGFAIWKQIVALNETAIAYVLEGVNTDVASVGDLLTRAQLMAVRDYILGWAMTRVVQRDRQRFWRKAFAKRTTSIDVSDPDVDLDLERVGVQSGFSLQPLSASPSATTVSADVAQQVWNASVAASFLHPAGFTKWMSVVDDKTPVSSSGLPAGVTGITSAEIAAISTWIQNLLDDGFIRRRALLHWTDGTCVTAMQLPRANGCLRYDLEPNIDGEQLGFEMNPDAVLAIASGISESARDALWDVTEAAVSFLMPAHSTDTTKYYARWLQAIRTSNYARLIKDSQQLTTLAVTEVSAQAIGAWLGSWAHNDLNTLAVYFWWLRSTCWPRVEISKAQVGSATVTTGETECTETPDEQEQSTTHTTSAEASPFFTDMRTYHVTEDTCTATGSSTFTRSRKTFTLTASVYSCDKVSTSVADDVDEETTGFELMPRAQNTADRISLAAAVVLWNPENALSFRSTGGYKRWISLSAHLSGNSAGAAAEAQIVADELNAAIALVCQAGVDGGGPSSGVFNETMTDTSCAQVTTAHVTLVAAWVNEQNGSTWVANALLDQWRRGGVGELDIEPYRDDLQSGLELTTGCENSALTSLTAGECSSISTENGTKYEVPREALDLWETTHAASILTVKGYAKWDSLASAVESGDATSIQTSRSALANLCGGAGASSTWETWMERVFQWLQRWRSNEHLVRDVLGHWLYARCPTTPTKVTGTLEPAPQTSTVSSCTESYTATLGASLDDIQQRASRPVTFFDANVVQDAALTRPAKTVRVTEAWTTCEQRTPSGFTKTVGTRQSDKEFQACNLLSVLATPDVDPTEVAHKDATFELNRTAPAAISIDVARALWDSQSDFSLLNATSFFEKWYPAIDRPTALQTVRDDLDTLVVGSSPPSELSAVHYYLMQWESSDAVALRIASLWTTATNAASVDVDVHETGDQGGFELYRSAAYKGAANLLTLPTLEQAKALWKTGSVYSIVRSAGTADGVGLPTGFRAWEEMYEGADYESEHLVAQYPLRNQVTRSSSMTHALSEQKRAQLLTAMTTITSLSEAQVRGIARWLFNWATDDSLRDFVLAQWATGETFRGDAKLSLDLASHLPRLYSFPVTSDMDRDHFTAASAALADASRMSLRKLWDVATTGSLLDPTSRTVWCLINVTDSDGNPRDPCAHLLDGYGVLETSAFDEFVELVQPTIPSTPIVQATADLSALALSFLEQALGLTVDHLQVIAKWYRQVPDSSLFFQVNQLDGWSAAHTEPSKDPLEFGYGLAFVLSWNTVIARSVSTSDLVANVAFLGASKTEKTIGECTKSLSLLYTLWDASNPASFLHPSGVSTWLSYVRGEIDAPELAGVATPTATVIDDQQLTDSTVSCLLQLVGHWLKSWSSHPSARTFVEEFWIAPITQSSASVAAALLPSATDMAKTFPLGELDPRTQGDTALFSTTDWWVAAARVLLDADESVALINPEEGFALWRALLIDCFTSDRATGKCAAPDVSSQYEATKARALRVLSRSLLDRIVVVSPSLSAVSDDALRTFTTSMIQEQVVPWLVALLDHTVLEQHVLERVRLANGDDDVAAGPLSFVDLAAVQFVNGSVTAANYTVRDGSTGRLILADNGTRSERFPREEFVFDDASGVVVQQSSAFLAGFGELRAFCSESGHDRRFAYDEDVTCSLGTDYQLSRSDAHALWTTFGFSDTTVWSWPKPNISASASQSGVPSPSALSPTFRSALLLDAFLAQPFETSEACEALMKTVNEAYDSDWSAQEKQHVCVDRTGETGVGEPNAAVYLQLPPLQNVQDKPVSFVQDLQTYLRYAATKFGYEPRILGLSGSPPLALSSSLTLRYPIGGYFAALTVSELLFASAPGLAGGSPRETPLWANATATERGASTFALAVPLADDAALYRKRKSVVGRLLSVDSSAVMDAWGEAAELSALRVTDGSQFTTAVLTGQGENSANASEGFPPQKLFFYWGYARRVAQLTFGSNTTRFGVPVLRYVADWASPSRLPTGLVVAGASAPSLNVSFLYDDLPLLVQRSSASSSPSVVDVDPRTGAAVHRRLAWQLTARVGDSSDRRVLLDVWHGDLQAGWLPVLWVEEEAAMSAGAAAAMATRGPFSPKTLSVFGVAGGACVIAVGCAVACVSVRRARVARLQRSHAIVPQAARADGAKAVQTIVDQTEDVETAGEGEGGAEATTRAWLHRAPE
ncbi:scavenger receptor class B, member [Phytophthora pseudosyringae]|uniref:Scavenger receptor class B, member n=1 Tax=Phytophthora pseudosyringae TaxID=221518 RepID=A0A8T1VJ84_9STRA|nr:scavenger receptor class B, member [Phytophthora pseudosyringae]